MWKSIDDAIAEEKELYEITKDNYEILNLKIAKDRAEEHSMMIAWLEELKQYKELEEQGLLVKLPVAIGSAVYVIDYTYECKFNYDCKLSFDEYKCEEDIRCEHECKKYRVRETRFNHMMLDKIGEKVFLTREEAEQALKQMKGE